MQISISVNRKRIPTSFFLYLGLSIPWTYWTLNVPFGSRIYQAIFAMSLFWLLLRVVITFIDYMKTLFDRSALLTLSEDGMTDHRSILSCGLIPWTRIGQVHLIQRSWEKIVLIKVKDPEIWISEQTFWKRVFLKEAYRRYGTPVLIRQSALAYDVDRLLEILQARVAG